MKSIGTGILKRELSRDMNGHYQLASFPWLVQFVLLYNQRNLKRVQCPNRLGLSISITQTFLLGKLVGWLSFQNCFSLSRSCIPLLQFYINLSISSILIVYSFFKLLNWNFFVPSDQVLLAYVKLDKKLKINLHDLETQILLQDPKMLL